MCQKIGSSSEETSFVRITDADGTVSHVGPLCLRNRVVVYVDDLVQILGDNVSDVVQLLMIKRAVLSHAHRKGDGC